MSWLNNIRTRLLTWILGDVESAYLERANTILGRREYRLGKQKLFLRPSRDGYNDNQITNYIGLIVDRSVSILFGKGVEFDYGESTGTDEEGDPVEKSTPIKDFVDEVWKANKKPDLLQALAKNGCESGMVFCKIAPQDDGTYKLIALDSSLMDIRTDPYDMAKVEKYIYQYKTTDRNGREMGVKEVTSLQKNEQWLVELSENSQASGDKWELKESIPWDYDFPPVVHWQNMINIGDTWGTPDITEELIGLQDQYNLNTSNRNKIIRYYAHPKRWSVGMNVRPANNVEVDGKKRKAKGDDVAESPDTMINFPTGEGNGFYQLPELGDLNAVMVHIEDLRQSMFETTRTVDVATIKDRLGQLTNFGLKVIYQDALQKMESKRELYGWGLKEINRRLLILSNMGEAECELTWPDPLPENEKEETEFLEADLRMGVVSKQTVAEKRGYTWEDEKKRMETEQAAMDDLGGALMKAFDRNGGVNPDKQMQQAFGKQVK